MYKIAMTITAELILHPPPVMVQPPEPRRPRRRRIHREPEPIYWPTPEGKTCGGCGKPIDLTFSLCTDCIKQYGRHADQWPEWLREHVNALQREYYAEKDTKRNKHPYSQDGKLYEDYFSLYGTIEDYAALKPESKATIARAKPIAKKELETDYDPAEELAAPQFDDWGNPIAIVILDKESFTFAPYEDIDKTIKAERTHERRLKALSQGKAKPGQDRECTRLHPYSHRRPNDYSCPNQHAPTLEVIPARLYTRVYSCPECSLRVYYPRAEVNQWLDNFRITLAELRLILHRLQPGRY